MSFVSRLAVTTTAAALVASVASAQVSRVTCESKNDKYQYCSANTSNEVRMIRQISDVRCEQGKSWGYDKQGVWVDHNCGAEFEVGRSGPSTSQKIAAGAAAGAAILQSMLAGSQPAATAAPAPATAPTGAVPAWLVGTFTAADPKTGQQVYFTVDANGGLEGRVNDKVFFGKVKGEQLFAGTAVLSYRGDGDGVFVYQAGKESEGVRFSPVK